MESITTMDETFKAQLLELESNVTILEILIEQLEKRLSNLRNEG